MDPQARQVDALPEGVDSAPFRPRTFADEAVKVIRHLILSGHFAAGERLNEINLAKMLQISRSPIREALKTLASAGLVHIVPGRGAFVADATLTTVRHLIEVRLALECAAARIVAERAADEQIEAIAGLLQTTRDNLRNDPAQPYPRDLDFHKQVLLATENPALIDAASSVSTQVQLARSRSGQDRAEQAYTEHERVFEALRARDADAAEQAMRDHILASLHSMERMLRPDDET